MSSMSVLLELSGLDSSSGGNLDCGDRDNRNRRVQPVRVAISGHEVQRAQVGGRGVRADWDVTSSAYEANHLQERCVDLATELFAVKGKFDDMAEELKGVKRQGEAKERDLKELQRVCDDERRSLRSLMRTVNVLEGEKSKLADQNADLRVDRDRLLSVLRRHTEAGRSESIAAHRERLRRRPMTEKEVNRCDLAAAKLELKTLRRENQRLLADSRRQSARVRGLEDGTTMLAKKLAEVDEELEASNEEKALLRRESDAAKAAERRAVSDLDREAALRLEAAGKASAAEIEAEEAAEQAEAAKLEAESLRTQVIAAMEQLSAKDSARARHQGSVARYQTMIDAQASALQYARQELLSEKVKRQESERQARLRHIAAIDSKNRDYQAAAAAASAFHGDATEPRESLGPAGRGRLPRKRER